MSPDFTSKGVRFSPYWHLSALVLVALPLAALLAAFFTHVEIVAQGVGRVVPLSAVRPVDSQAAGEIVEVMVAPGDLVKAGDTILRLDDKELLNARQKLAERAARLQQDKLRLQAAIATSEKMDPADAGFEGQALQALAAAFNGNAADLARMTARLRAEVTTLTSGVAEIDANVQAAIAAQAGFDATITRAKTVLSAEAENVGAARKLTETRNISQTEYLRRTQDLATAKGDLEVAQQDKKSKQADEAALRQRRKSLVSNTVRDWYAGLETTDQQLRETDVENRDVERRLGQMVVRAPTTGRIEEFKVRTVGARVAEGQSIARIVPSNDRVEIEARLPSSESSFLRVGQRAVLNLDAYPAERFGSLSGTIRAISADSVQEGATGWHYVLLITPTDTALATSSGRIELTPGMTLRVHVVTGERRLVSYLFEPVVRALSDGLHER